MPIYIPTTLTTPQVCLFWRRGKACQIPVGDEIDRVCVRSSAYVRWGAASLTMADGATCKYQVRAQASGQSH
jgi:hypothetical protein